MGTAAAGKKYDVLSQMIKWEQGELDVCQTVLLFEHLIDSGLCWKLQGCYGREAAKLIRAGLCTEKSNENI
jgi:hypothetical protein